MRTIGTILIIAGILMFVFTGFNYQTKKRVVDVGPIQIDKTENHNIGWPAYAGGFAILAGIVILFAAKKKV